MINSGDISQRTKAITNELNALKSKQNMGGYGMEVPSASASYRANFTFQNNIGGTIHFRFTVDNPSSNTPIAFLAFNYDYENTGDDGLPFAYFAPPTISTLSPSTIVWDSLCLAGYVDGVTGYLNIEAQVFSIVSGVLTIWT